MTPIQLKQWRIEKGWSQEQAAKELSVSIHTVRAWEQGKNPVPQIVEKHILTEVDLRIPLDIITTLKDVAFSSGEPFEKVLVRALRAGLVTLKPREPEAPASDHKISVSPAPTPRPKSKKRGGGEK